MRKWHFLPVATLAAAGLLAATTAAAATPGSGARHHAKQLKKTAPQARKAKQPKAASRKRAPKFATKPAPKFATKPVPKSAPLAAAMPRLDPQASITAPGDYRYAIEQDGRERTYRVHVPPGYAPSEPAPLVVALGSAGSPASEALQALGREADRQGFIAVFPEPSAGRGSPAARWNTGTGAADGDGVRDVRFVETVIANVFRQTSVARHHIYAAGIGDGGTMAYRLACDLPGLFRAVASVGGPDTNGECAVAAPVSVLHFASGARAPVLAGLRDAAGAQLPASVAAATDSAARWARRNGCMEAPQRVLERAGSYCDAWSYCRGGAEVQMCVAEPVSRAAASADTRRLGGAPAPAALPTQAMWGFFSSR